MLFGINIRIISYKGNYYFKKSKTPPEIVCKYLMETIYVLENLREAFTPLIEEKFRAADQQ